MQIDKHSVVTLHYTLKDNDGNILDESSDGSFCYLHGENNIIPGLESALAGRISGDELSVTVPPEEGYGEHDAERTQAVPRDMFPPEHEIEPGMQFQAQGPEGQALLVTVVKVEEDSVTVDGNHPLAGVQLNFDVKIIEVRTANEEEIEHGHVHGPGGHHHE